MKQILAISKKLVNNIFEYLLKVIFKMTFAIFRFTGLSNSRMLKNLIQTMEKNEKSFVTYHFRPMQAENINSRIDVIRNKKKLAIVLQGPVLRDNDFTLETVKLYKKHFPQAIIVLSTWKEESPEIINKFESLAVEIVLNDKPEYFGFSNINLQIVSSGNGMKQAKDLGAEYAIKTRTDQRFYAPNIDDFLYNITQLFPVNYPGQKQRIVGVSLNTFKYRLYGLSDMFAYGHIDDMLSFWNPQLDTRTMELPNGKAKTPGKFSRLRLCEVYLATEFLKKIGREVSWSLKDSWQVFADHFCVVDKEQLDILWPKYNRLEYPYQTYIIASNSKKELTFRDWINVYYNLDNIDIPEYILDQ